jgi:hypothetical protein
VGGLVVVVVVVMMMMMTTMIIQISLNQQPTHTLSSPSTLLAVPSFQEAPCRSSFPA